MTGFRRPECIFEISVNLVSIGIEVVDGQSLYSDGIGSAFLLVQGIKGLGYHLGIQAGDGQKVTLHRVAPALLASKSNKPRPKLLCFPR